MRNCPKCNSEVEDNFDLCWNCNFSFSENKVVEFEDADNNEKVKVKDIDCLRCKVPMVFSGNFKFHEGTRFGIFGNLFEALTNRESFDFVYLSKMWKS